MGQGTGRLKTTYQKRDLPLALRLRGRSQSIQALRLNLLIARSGPSVI